MRSLLPTSRLSSGGGVGARQMRSGYSLPTLRAGLAGFVLLFITVFTISGAQLGGHSGGGSSDSASAVAQKLQQTAADSAGAGSQPLVSITRSEAATAAAADEVGAAVQQPQHDGPLGHGRSTREQLQEAVRAELVGLFDATAEPKVAAPKQLAMAAAAAEHAASSSQQQAAADSATQNPMAGSAEAVTEQLITANQDGHPQQGLETAQQADSSGADADTLTRQMVSSNEAAHPEIAFSAETPNPAEQQQSSPAGYHIAAAPVGNGVQLLPSVLSAISDLIENQAAESAGATAAGTVILDMQQQPAAVPEQQPQQQQQQVQEAAAGITSQSAGQQLSTHAAAQQVPAIQQAPVDLLAGLQWEALQAGIAIKGGGIDGGGGDAAKTAICGALTPAGAKNIAVVGNGPLQAHDRSDIAGADWVVRFNYLDNHLPGERVDLWVGRADLLDESHWQRGESYYPSHAPDAASGARKLLLLGSPNSLTPANIKAFRLPPGKVKRAVQVDISSFSTAFSSAATPTFQPGPRTGIPSSGAIVLLAATVCAGEASAKVHAYGMNWTPRLLPMVHFAERERAVLMALHSQESLLKVHLHRECDGFLRQCAEPDHMLCRASWRNCQPVHTAMLAHMFDALSFQELLAATQSASGQLLPDLPATPTAALDAVWTGTQSLAIAQQSPFCKMFEGKGSATGGGKRIALVGNGPLTDAQRAEINAFDSVVRFNFLNNRLPGERVDVWVACFGWESNGGLYWGFHQMSRTEALEALASRPTVVLFGGYSTSSANPLLRRFSQAELPSDKVVYLSLERSDEQFYSGYHAIYGTESGKFLTTGFRVAVATVACRQPGAEVHLYGFNWSPASWEGHDTALERKMLIELANQGYVKVHLPPCDGVRRCAKFRDIHGYTVRQKDGFEGKQTE